MTSSTSSAISKLNTDNDYGGFCLNSSKRLVDSQESDSSPSPPSYAVFEDEHGNLVNPALNVIWPVRPHRGRYSLNEYKEQKRRLKLAEQRRQSKKYNFKNRKCGKQSERQPDVSRTHKPDQTKDNNNIYIGVRSMSSVRSILRPAEFRLFYMRPELMDSFDQMPVKMPLMLAYMSSSGRIYNFSFKRHEYNSGTFWQLDLSDIEGPEQPIFHSMSALVQHYKSFVIDRGNGKSEVFPVD